jgi:hypothetical protein
MRMGREPNEEAEAQFLHRHKMAIKQEILKLAALAS